MSRIKNFRSFLRESVATDKRDCVADVQIRIVVTSEKDPKKLALRPESFMPSQNAKREVGQTVNVATHTGQFVKTGAYAGYAYKGTGNEKVVPVSNKDYFTVAFTPAEMQDGAFRLTLDKFPETLTLNNMSLTLSRVTTFCDYKPGSIIALQSRAKTVQTGINYDQFLEHGVSETMPIHGKTVTCKLSGARNVVYLVYAPAVDVAGLLSFRFENTFEYNSTKINVEASTYKETLQALVNQLKKGTSYQMTVHGNASKVPTSYMSKIDTHDGAPTSGNEALAHDRAKAMLAQLREDVTKAGVKFETVIKQSQIEYKVTGEEYDNDADEKAKYDQFQFVEVRLTPLRA